MIQDEFGADYEIAVAIAKAESNLNPKAHNVNRNGTVDRGLWQINNKYHPEVSDECAYNVGCATKEAARIYKQRGCNEWATCEYAKKHESSI